MKQIVSALKPLFDHINDQFKQINGQFEKIDSRFEKIDSRFEKIDSRFEKMDGRFDMLDAELASVKGVARRTAVQVAKLVGEAADIKHTMGAKVASKDDFSLVHARMDAFVPEVEASRRRRFSESDAFMLQQRRLDNHEKRLARLETRRA